jgi:hypothetical protein
MFFVVTNLKKAFHNMRSHPNTNHFQPFLIPQIRLNKFIRSFEKVLEPRNAAVYE